MDQPQECIYKNKYPQPLSSCKTELIPAVFICALKQWGSQNY